MAAVPHRLSRGLSRAPLANSVTLTPTERAAKHSQHEEAALPEIGINDCEAHFSSCGLVQVVPEPEAQKWENFVSIHP